MPSRETVWFVPLLGISLLIAMSLTVFLSPVIGVPLLLLAAIFGAVGWFGGNRGDTAGMEGLRDQARDDVQFTSRDRESLTPAESDPAR